MSAPQDFLALEQELLARLRECLPQCGEPRLHLFTAAELADVQEERQLTPAVHLLYRSYRPLEHGSARRVVRMEQTWLAVVATRQVRSLKTGEDARANASRLAGWVVSTLLGFHPPSATGPLALAPAPPATPSAGHLYLPLAFTAEVVLKAHQP